MDLITTKRLSANREVDRAAWLAIHETCCRTGDNGRPMRSVLQYDPAHEDAKKKYRASRADAQRFAGAPTKAGTLKSRPSPPLFRNVNWV
jgi:hypothetical protein